MSGPHRIVSRSQNEVNAKCANLLISRRDEGAKAMFNIWRLSFVFATILIHRVESDITPNKRKWHRGLHNKVCTRFLRSYATFKVLTFVSHKKCACTGCGNCKNHRRIQHNTRSISILHSALERTRANY